MPQLDLASLGLITLVNLVAMSLILPVAMGRQISPAARQVQRHFLLQAVAWGGLVAVAVNRGSPWEPVLAIGATVAVALAHWTLSQALAEWLGPRPGRLLLHLCCIVGPLGFALLWSMPLYRFTWFSLCQGTGLLLLARMCLYPRKDCERGWRAVLCGCVAFMALLLWLRAVYAWTGGQPLLYASPGPVNHAFALASNICNTVGLVAVLVAWRDETNQKLREMALTDQLTGLANRHALQQAAPHMQQLAQRQQLPFAVMLLDLDLFKTVNDQYGHTMGDQALQLLAQVLHVEVRANEVAARWGGEEFCVLMYADAETVQGFYRRLSAQLLQHAQQQLGFGLHLSAGCVLQTPPLPSFDQLLQQADAALYRAKSQGRQQLVFAHQPAPHPAVTSGA